MFGVAGALPPPPDRSTWLAGAQVDRLASRVRAAGRQLGEVARVLEGGA